MSWNNSLNGDANPGGTSISKRILGIGATSISSGAIRIESSRLLMFARTSGTMNPSVLTRPVSCGITLGAN